MTISKQRDGEKLVITLEGRLDTNTAPKFEEELQTSCNGLTELVIDMRDLTYVSSAGLRALLYAQKMMNKQGNMVIRNANEDVKDVFMVTGFMGILNIE